MNRVTRFNYDALGRLASVIDSKNVLAEQYTYTNNGLPATFIDARGNTTKTTYDGFDRTSQITYAFGTGLASSESFTFDADDNLKTRVTRKGDTITFAYDTLNRLSTKTVPSSPTVSYSYDLAGRITGISDNSSSIAAAVPPAGTSVVYATNATYDQLNRPTNVTWSPAATPAAPSASNVTFTHGYNQSNQRVSQGTTDNTWFYYPSGTSSTSYTANALNQYTAVGAVTPTYDNNGNLPYDGTFTLGYDVENRLTSAMGAGNTVTYAYDSQGRRKRKTVNGTSTLFITDADNREVLEYDGSTGQVQGWYAYGGQGEVLNRMDVPANTRQTLIPDIQGSVIATMDSSTGAMTKRGYLPYGQSASTSGSFAYTGLRIDPETNGFYYVRARMYSTLSGRFLQPDPIGYAGGKNLYSYVGNDPLNFTDWRGLAAESSQSSYLVAGGPSRSMSTGPSSPVEEINAAGREVRYQQLMGQIQAVNPNFQAPATIGPPGSGRSPGELRYLESVIQAREQYPNQPQRMEEHHVTPQYLGGPRNGPTVPLDAAQHEVITQQMRQQMPFGQPPPPPAQVQQFLQDFYLRNPLPPSTMEQLFPKSP